MRSFIVLFIGVYSVLLKITISSIKIPSWAGEISKPTSLSRKHTHLRSVPRSQVNESGVRVPAGDPSTRQVEIGRVPGASWPASLAYSERLWPIKTVSENRADGPWSTAPELASCLHRNAHQCEYMQIQTHTKSPGNNCNWKVEASTSESPLNI